jgi:amino acid permease
MGNRERWGSAGILAATTLGAGIFALPYIFKESGWLTGLFYLAALSGIVIFAHFLYWQVLAKIEEKKRLLGLTEKYLGNAAGLFAFVVIVAGLILTLVVYLILASHFLKLIFSHMSEVTGIFIFWVLASLPIIFKLRWFARFELLGALLMAAIIIFIFLIAGNLTAGFSNIAAINFKNIFLPFGPILFALAGWTAIEPLFEYEKKAGRINSSPLPILFLGTGVVAGLYLLFTFGILGSSAEIVPDTVSGLMNWPFWKLGIMGLLGIFAIWTSYVPIVREIRNILERDAGWPMILSFCFVLFIPPLLIIIGLNNFLAAVGLAGGVFLGLQYLLIVLVAKKATNLGKTTRFFANLSAIIVILAAIYETYKFVIQ